MAENDEHRQVVAVEKRIDDPLFRGLRASIAAIPFVGGSISVLVESEISRRQAQRVELLFSRIAEIESQIGEYRPEDNFLTEDRLLENAVNKARAATEAFRSKLLANCLFVEREKDREGILRTHLLELAGTLTIIELAILKSMQARTSETDSLSEIASALHKIDLADGETAEIREYAHKRLAQLFLIDGGSDRGSLTRIGSLVAESLE